MFSYRRFDQDLISMKLEIHIAFKLLKYFSLLQQFLKKAKKPIYGTICKAPCLTLKINQGTFEGVGERAELLEGLNTFGIVQLWTEIICWFLIFMQTMASSRQRSPGTLCANQVRGQSINTQHHRSR